MSKLIKYAHLHIVYMIWLIHIFYVYFFFKIFLENKTAGDFVIYETAYRFVQLAEEQLSSNEKAAPAIAIAVIALWLESAEFGELFMSQLYNTCPILIPNTFNENVDEQKLKQMVSGSIWRVDQNETILLGWYVSFICIISFIRLPTRNSNASIWHWEYLEILGWNSAW